MKKNKIDLKSLKVESFVTSIESTNQLLGGGNSEADPPSISTQVPKGNEEKAPEM